MKTIFVLGLFGLLLSSFLLFFFKKGPSFYKSPYISLISKEFLNEKNIQNRENNLKSFERFEHFTNNSRLDVPKFLETVENLPEFLFFLVFYDEAELVFLSGSTKYYNFSSSPALPMTRFLPNYHYCFYNFLYVMYEDPSFSGLHVGFEYTLTNESKSFLNASFNGNFWPDPYNKRKTKSEASRKRRPGFNMEVDIEQNRKPIYTLDPKIKAFFTSTYWHSNHFLGKEFSCMFQITNHLPGHTHLALKNHFVTASREYAKIYEGKKQCFDPQSLVPKSWLLKNQEECLDFFREIDKPEYHQKLKEKGPLFIRKIAAGSHRGKGVEVVDEREEADLRAIYENGAKCGEVNKNYMIQDYIGNPLTVDGHKFDFRVYLNIVSTDPFIVMFHDGFLKVSLYEYDPQSSVKAAHITSSELSKEIFKRVEAGDNSFNMTANELRDYQLWTFSRFHEHLMKTGKVSDPNWVSNFLRPAFRRAMIHIAQMNYKYFLKNPTIYEVFGTDFMFDDEFNLWFLECNSNPELMPTNEYKEIFFHTLVKENIEVSLSFVRSRAKRLLKYITDLKNEILKGVSIDDRDPEQLLRLIYSRINGTQVREDLRKLSKNKLEEDFPIPSDNTYQWVLDYSQTDSEQVYKDLLPSECIIDLSSLVENDENDSGLDADANDDEE